MTTTENAVAEALALAHRALLSDLRELEQAASRPSQEGLEDLRARLGAAHTHITEHFRFEEENGYMDAVRKREPRLERTIEQLAAEHRELARTLSSLIGEASAVTGRSRALRQGVQEWIKRVQQHEIRENGLVQEAFNVDIGTKD